MKKKTNAPKYIDPGTGEVRGTLKIPPVPTPDEVHRSFHGSFPRRSSENVYDDDDNKARGSVRQEDRIYPKQGWEAERKAALKPGPVKVYTKAEIAEYTRQRDWVEELDNDD